MKPTILARHLLSTIEYCSGKKAQWSAIPAGDGQVEVAVWSTDGPVAISKRFDFRTGPTEALVSDVCRWILPMTA